MSRVFATILAGCLLLGGCGFSGIGSGDSGLFPRGGLRGSVEEVDGLRFRSRVTSLGEDDRGFAVRTRGAGRALSAAAEAGRTEAVRYCLTRFGGSEIAWLAGPDREITQMAIEDDGALLLTGRCIAR